MSRAARPIASDLLSAGWLPPNAAAAAYDVTVKQLERMAERGEVRRRELMPGTRLFLYEVRS
ncbi:MAG: hypothetical protein AB7O24_04350 [Kofleriaceae bacterium]